MTDRVLIADQKRPCACPETQVDSGDGLPVSAVPGLSHKILYDFIGPTEKRRHQPLNGAYESGDEVFLVTHDSRGLVSSSIRVKNIDCFEQLTTQIGRLQMRKCGPKLAFTIFVAYAPTSSYEEEEVEAFYMDLEKFHTL
ncbi:hypothetical protein RB195_014681 [Necator americanus]|uniref:Uncharacterized protein n=1 Tax=Necator americanus TaxID=51031 RepID=A0ABR1E1E2_NECAM